MLQFLEAKRRLLLLRDVVVVSRALAVLASYYYELIDCPVRLSMPIRQRPTDKHHHHQKDELPFPAMILVSSRVAHSLARLQCIA